MDWVRRILLGFLAAVLVSGTSAAAEKLRIVTSFLPAWSLTSSIAGEHAEVVNLLPGNVSLHDYQLSPRDLRQLSSARLIVINGLGMENFLERALHNLGDSAAEKLVVMSRGLENQLITETGHGHDDHAAHDHDHGHDHGDVNPHIWLDPRLAAHAATNILTALQQADPAHAADYANNAAALVKRLHVLDRDLAARLAPIRQVPFITYHNAFPYFVRRYSLNLAGVVEEVPEVSPSPRDMTRLLRTIREKKVQALFTEPQERSRLAERVAADAGIDLAELDPLETGELAPGAYEKGMRRNAETLLKTLQP